MSAGAGLKSAQLQTPPASRSGYGFGALVLLLLGVTLPVLILDQLSKYYVSTHMILYQDIAVIPHWFDITYTRNPGAAFSLFINLPAWFRSGFLMALPVIAIVVLLALIARRPRVTLTTVSFALILAGAIGNLIDRAVRGQVIDFVRLHYYSHSYPVFNVADSAITIGVILIIAEMLLAGEAAAAPRG